MWRCTSSNRATGVPSSATMRSPGCSPARAAAEFSTTVPTVALGRGWPTVM
jgi:hypothetical protein